MLFDIPRISAALLPRKELRWFCDQPMDRIPLTAGIADRLTELARRWDGYEHPDYGEYYGEFARNRNRCNFEDMYINRRCDLADRIFYDAFVRQGEYDREIQSMLSLILSEETWCVPAHTKNKPPIPVRHVLELYAAETCAIVAVATAYMGDRIPNSLRSLAAETVRERMFIPFAETDGYGWMGANGQKVNNWNPWIHSNVMLCAALLCEDEEEYRALVLRACSLTENYVRSIGPEAQCDEGVRYWNLSGACLFDIAEIVFDLTGGAVDLTKSETVYRTCDYMTAMYDETGLPANFADATIEFYPDAPMLVRAGERTGNELMRDMGRSLYRPEQLRVLHDNFYRQMKNICTAAAIVPCPPPSYPRRSLLAGINVCTLRDNSFFLCMKGGHNNESHNHNDLGNFVLYHRGTPLFVDPGVDLYSGYTFSEWRYKLWYLNSDYHNLPVIGGEKQKYGSAYKAQPIVTGECWAQTEISGAYGIGEKWYRRAEITDGHPVITDTFESDPGAVQLYCIFRDEPKTEKNAVVFPSGERAVWEGAEIRLLERIDLSGMNPPDGIPGDAPNRHKAPFSCLIPRRFEEQWGQEHLWRLCIQPTEKTVRMTVYSD